MSSTTDQDPTPNPPVDLKQVLREAAAGHVESGRITELSDPSRDHLEDFSDVWPTLPVATRREVIREMMRQSDENLALDFTRYCHHALNDPDDEVRTLAVNALWEETSQSFLLQISDMAMTDESAAVQEAIALALGAFSFEAEIDELDPEGAAMTQRALFHLIENGANWMVKRRALESSAYLSRNQAVKDLIQEAYESDFEQEIAGALVAMGRNLDPRWNAIILAELKNEDPDIRCEAARAAGEFGNPAAIDQLAKMIDDEDDEIRTVAVLAIGQIGGTKAIESLRYLETQVEEEELKETVRAALEEARFLAESTGLEER